MGTLRETIVKAVAADGRTVYAIARDAMMDASHLRRVLSGKASLTLDSLERLIGVLGLGLIPTQMDAPRGKPRPLESKPVDKPKPAPTVPAQSPLRPERQMTEYEREKLRRLGMG